MATRRRKKTTTKRKRTTKRGMVRRTARKAYAPKKRVARRPAIQIGLGAYLATSKATQAYKPLGYGMIAVAAANLVSSIMGGMASGQAPVASSGWMPASVVGQRYLSPPTSDIPLNSFLADIVVPA